MADSGRFIWQEICWLRRVSCPIHNHHASPRLAEISHLVTNTQQPPWHLHRSFPLAMTKDVPPSKHVQPSTPRWARWSVLLNAVALAALLQAEIRSAIPYSFPWRQSSPSQPTFSECRAPLPPFLATKAPSGTEAPLQKAFNQLDSALQRDFNRGGMDSLSVAVVGSDGSLYEGFWGQRRANESDIGEGTTVDRHSIYRVASISKLFTALETLILRDRGVLKL